MESWKILTIANVVPRKRIDLCAKASAVLEKEHPLTWTVIGGGSDLDKVRAMAPASMEFTGRVEDLQPFYRAADLFVLPSLDEGFGMVYIESIMCGCPVICRRSDGGEEIVNTTGGGVAVDLAVDDDEAVRNICDAARSILGNRGKYASEETIARARQMVDPGAIKQKWQQILERHGAPTLSGSD